MRALVIDDEDGVREAVADALREGGFDVDTAASGEEAAALLAAPGLDLLLSDLRLPGSTGLDLLAAAKLHDPTLPVVLMTGHGDLGSTVEALRNGADDYLTKPLEAGELLRVCRRAAEKGRLLRENRLQRERLERLYRVKSQFLAAMSHELRTPLTTIIGMSEMLADGWYGALNPKQQSYAATIQESARHLLALINDVLDYSKCEAGRMELHPCEVRADDAIATACAVVAGQAQRRRIALSAPAGAGLPPFLADRGKVVQVLVNLLSNAIKFSPEGSAVEVGFAPGGDALRFSVRDRGAGIAADQLERIFEEFHQVHGGASGKDPGTGLGLALSRRLARMHGGDVEVESRPGEGSTFTLRLPASCRLEHAAAG